MAQTIIERAETFARYVHRDQKRKGTGAPYAEHLADVARRLKDADQPDDVVAAGWLHDTIEDTDVTASKLVEVFDFNISQLVLEVTDAAQLSDGKRWKRAAINLRHLRDTSVDGASIKLADIASNLSDLPSLPAGFRQIYIPEKAMQVAVLSHGHPALWAHAWAAVEAAEKQWMSWGLRKCPSS